MTTPTRPGLAGDLEPGWSRDEPSPYGPCYQRHAPGKGILRVVARGGQDYAWYLSTTSRPESLSWPRDGFARPRDAMRDADQVTPRLPVRMFEVLTPDEAQELYRKLARAKDWGRDWGRPGETALDEVRDELFRQMQIQATDPGYRGPDLHTFTRAVREASRGAALQAMSASPNKGSWISMTPHGGPQRLAAAASRGASIAHALPASPDFPNAPAGRPAGSPARRGAGSGSSPRPGQASPRGIRP
jgi:hypothetical protein